MRKYITYMQRQKRREEILTNVSAILVAIAIVYFLVEMIGYAIDNGGL